MVRDFPKDESKEKKEETEVKEEIGDIVTITQEAGFYVVAQEGRIPCHTIAEAKILSLLLQKDKQK